MLNESEMHKIALGRVELAVELLESKKDTNTALDHYTFAINMLNFATDLNIITSSEYEVFYERVKTAISD